MDAGTNPLWGEFDNQDSGHSNTNRSSSKLASQALVPPTPHLSVRVAEPPGPEALSL